MINGRGILLLLSGGVLVVSWCIVAESHRRRRLRDCWSRSTVDLTFCRPREIGISGASLMECGQAIHRKKCSGSFERMGDAEL